MLRRLRSQAIATVGAGLGAIYTRRLARYGELRELLAQLGPRGGANSTGVSEADSVMLYETVRDRKPRYVLELGAGRSSAGIALALRRDR